MLSFQMVEHRDENAFIASYCLQWQHLNCCAQTCVAFWRAVRQTQTFRGCFDWSRCIFDSWPVCVFAGVTCWGGFEEIVAETKPVAGAAWPTYRNTH